MIPKERKERIINTVRSCNLQINKNMGSIILSLAKMQTTADNIYESLTEGLEDSVNDVKLSNEIYDAIYTPYNEFKEAVLAQLGKKIATTIEIDML